MDSIDSYQYILQQIAYASKSPVTYLDRAFTLSCNGVDDQAFTNELTVRVRIFDFSSSSTPTLLHLDSCRKTNARIVS